MLVALIKFYHSNAMNPSTGPRALQAKVMFNIHFYFARQGSENFKQMKGNTFCAVWDDDIDLMYIKKNLDEMQKNHTEQMVR